MLTALLLLSAALVACNDSTPDPEVTDAPTDIPTEAETDDGIPLDSLTIGGVDIKNYTLVVQDGGAGLSIIGALCKKTKWERENWGK